MIDPAGYALARQWLRSARTPRWARRHTPQGWSRALSAVAAHGWTCDDLNQLLVDWERSGGHWMPPSPHKPIGLVCAAIAWHRRASSLQERPAALITAQEDERRALREHERRQAQTDLEASQTAKRDTQRRWGNPAHQSARDAAAAAARRAAEKRAARQAAELEARAELVARASR